MMYHDNPRRSVNPDFAAPRLTLSLCRDRARLFVADVVRPGLQWDMRTMRNYCVPAGYHLPDDALYSGPATIADIASFLRANLQRHA